MSDVNNEDDRMPDSYYESDNWGFFLDETNYINDPMGMFNFNWLFHEKKFFRSNEEDLCKVLDHFLQLDLFLLQEYTELPMTRDDLIMAWIDLVLRLELDNKPVRDS